MKKPPAQPRSERNFQALNAKQLTDNKVRMLASPDANSLTRGPRVMRIRTTIPISQFSKIIFAIDYDA
jgi:hypothetical protein